MKNFPSEFEQWLNQDDVEDIYFNHFGVGSAENDMVFLLFKNGKLQVRLNASHSTAKSLLEAIQDALEQHDEYSTP